MRQCVQTLVISNYTTLQRHTQPLNYFPDTPGSVGGRRHGNTGSCEAATRLSALLPFQQ